MSELQVNVGSDVSKHLTKYFTSRTSASDMIVTATLPSAVSADQTQLYRLTVDNKVYYSDGARWYSQGFGQPQTAVVDGDFTWYNQGAATSTSVNGGIFLSVPSTATTQFRGRIKSKTAPYTITAALWPLFYPGNYVRTGIFFTDGTKTHVFGVAYNSGVSGIHLLTSSTFTNSTTINADYSILTFHHYGSVVWLRIADNSTNRICSFSPDGTNFIPFHTIGRTDFLTATSVGFGGDIENSNAGGLMLLSWEES